MKDALLISIRPGVLRSTAAVRAYFYLLYSEGGREEGRERKRYKGNEKEAGREERMSRGKNGGRKEEGRKGRLETVVFSRELAARKSRARRERAQNSRLLTRGYQLFFPPYLYRSRLPSTLQSPLPLSLSLSLIVLMKFRHGWILRDTNFFRRETKSVFPAYPSIDLCRK